MLQPTECETSCSIFLLWRTPGGRKIPEKKNGAAREEMCGPKGLSLDKIHRFTLRRTFEREGTPPTCAITGRSTSGITAGICTATDRVSPGPPDRYERRCNSLRPYPGDTRGRTAHE